MILTEDLGKMFEMAICLLYDTPYNGKYKYGLDGPNMILPKIQKLLDHFPKCKHTAEKASRYDFTSSDGKFLSAKTTKGDKKVCPQVIGQPTRKTFCEKFKLPNESTNDDIKNYILENVSSMMSEYFDHTFDCDIIYYNRKIGTPLFIHTKSPIQWDTIKFSFSHIEKNTKWNESTTVYATKNGTTQTIGEFQVHKHRNCIKFRWNFDNVLNTFPDNFEVTKF
jgi:hypothetical protein